MVILNNDLGRLWSNPGLPTNHSSNNLSLKRPFRSIYQVSRDHSHEICGGCENWMTDESRANGPPIMTLVSKARGKARLGDGLLIICWQNMGRKGMLKCPFFVWPRKSTSSIWSLLINRSIIISPCRRGLHITEGGRISFGYYPIPNPSWKLAIIKLGIPANQSPEGILPRPWNLWLLNTIISFVNLSFGYASMHMRCSSDINLAPVRT